jgi:hypothetical protein
MVLARPREKSMTKIDSKNSLYTHSHFTEHLVCAFEKPPWKNNLNHESLSLLIRRLKNHTGMNSCNKSQTHDRKSQLKINQTTVRWTEVIADKNAEETSWTLKLVDEPKLHSVLKNSRAEICGR